MEFANEITKKKTNCTEHFSGWEEYKANTIKCVLTQLTHHITIVLVLYKTQLKMSNSSTKIAMQVTKKADGIIKTQFYKCPKAATTKNINQHE